MLIINNMAHNDIEIEIKLAVAKVEFDAAEKFLQENGHFEGSHHHLDTYFTPADRDWMAEPHPVQYLRIGTRNGKTILCYKHYYINPDGSPHYCDEFETLVENRDQLEKIFSALKMRTVLEVDKQRETFVYKDVLEIALDNVKNLGYFIEIESLKDLGGIDKAKEEIFKAAKEIGLKELRIDGKGYVQLLYEKQHV